MNPAVTARSTNGLFVVAAGISAAAVFVGSHLVDMPGSLAELLRATNGVPILDLSPVFAVDETYARIEAYGEEGRRLYRRFVVTTDIVFPLVLFTFLILLARFTGERVAVPPALRWLLLAMPFGFLIPDLIENFVVFSLLTDFPDRHDMLARMLPYVTVTKRLSFYAAVTLPLAVLAVWVLLGPQDQERMK